MFLTSKGGDQNDLGPAHHEPESSWHWGDGGPASRPSPVLSRLRAEQGPVQTRPPGARVRHHRQVQVLTKPCRGSKVTSWVQMWKHDGQPLAPPTANSLFYGWVN